MKQNKFNKCDICQLTCRDCNRKYIGQTGSPFHVTFQKKFRNFKYGNGKSEFAQYLLDNKHSIGSMEGIVEMLRITNKGSMMNSLERYIMKQDLTFRSVINAQ